MDYTDALKELKALTSTGDALKADLIDLAKRVSIQAPGVHADAARLLRHAPVHQHASGRKVAGQQQYTARIEATHFH